MPRPSTLLGLVCIALLAPTPGQAKETTPSQHPDFMLDRWGVEDGLPLDHVRGLALDEQGYLWVGTFDGLARFDGERFQRFGQDPGAELPSGRLVDLSVAADSGGVFVVSEYGHVSRFDEAGLQSWMPGEQVPGLARQVVHAGGATWVLASRGLARVQGADLRAVDELGGLDVRSLAEVGGRLWVGTDGSGLYALEPTEPEGAVEEVQLLPRGLRFNRLGATPSGALWVATSGGAWILEDGEAARIPAPEGVDVCEVSFDGSDVVVRTEEGWWSSGPEPVLLTSTDRDSECAASHPDYLSSRWRREAGAVTWRGQVVYGAPPKIWGTLEDPRGGLWVGTEGRGLVRVRPRAVESLPLPAEARTPIAQTVLFDRDGDLWVGAGHGPVQRGGPDGLRTLRPWASARPPAPSAASLLQTADGTVWSTLPEGLCRVEEDTCALVPLGPLLPPREPIRALFEDSRGALWVGSKPGLLRGNPPQEERRWEQVEFEGAPLHDVATFAEGADGSLLLGTLGSGLLLWRDGFVRRWTTADGLSSDFIRHVSFDERGVVWIGTEGKGLCRLDAGLAAPPVCLGRRDGLFHDSVHSVVEDDADRLWMSSNEGIFWVRRADVDAFAAGLRDRVMSVGLDERHGMADREANGGVSPASARDARGRLWFPTQAGVAVVDPARASLPGPPRVSVDSLRVGQAGEAVALRGEPVRLSSQQREVAAAWSTPEFDHPEQVLFRYRLAGFEETWRGPSAERRAAWTNIPPGEFAVEVQAALGGDWGPIARSRVIDRRPAFVETGWARAALALAGLLAGGALVWMRGRSLRRRRRELELEVEARTGELARANETLGRRADQLRVQAETLARQNDEIADKAARVVEADEQCKRLIADLSHELRTPLMLVLGPLSDLESGGQLSDGPGRRSLGMLRRNANRLKFLVDQLFDSASLDAGAIQLRVRHLDFGLFLARVADRFAPTAEHLGLRLEVDLPPHPTPLFFDPDLVDKVVSNLLSNALKFTPEGGAVTLRLRGSADEEDEGEALVTVSDTGIGIPKERSEHLFERFVQGDQGNARRYGGVGIGLALARDLVAMHGGAIGAEAGEEGGSRFWFTLPRGAAHLAPADIDLQSHPDAPDGEQLVAGDDAPSPTEPDREDLPRVLVVEDHQDMRDFLVAHLRAHFSVRAAASGAEALRMATERPPQVIVSDVMMPGMDGLELCRRLRADPQLAPIPVLLASAKGSEDDRVAGLELAQDYLVKPLSTRELIVRVRRLVKAPTEVGEDRAGVEPGALREERPRVELPATDLALLGKLERTVAERLDDSSLNVNGLASSLGYSRRQLLREVRRLTESSPTEYIRRARMDKARKLLSEGEVETVAEAAAAVGLTPAYFSRLYRAHFGVAPSTELRG